MSQILRTEKILQNQQTQAIQHKECIMESKINNRFLIVLSLIAPALLIGWRLGRGPLLGSVTKQLTEIGLLAISTQFKKQLFNIFKA